MIITEGFLCYPELMFFVTYRAQLTSTNGTDILELIQYIETWIGSGAEILVGSQDLKAEISCPVIISYVNESSCTPIHSSSTTEEATGSSSLGISYIAIIGGVSSAVFLILMLVVLASVIVFIRLRLSRNVHKQDADRDM